MRRLTFRRSAEQELIAAAIWYERREEGLGAAFLDAIKSTLQRVQESPLTHPEWRAGSLYRRIVVRKFPYLLFYVVDEEEISIVAVAHGRRRPGYWTRRTR